MAEIPSKILMGKMEGETPLEALSRLRVERPELADVALTYAGRLDPMASGVLLVLVGEENKNREQYLNLDKEYEVEVLFGISTDTGDVLGKVCGIFSNDAPVYFVGAPGMLEGEQIFSRKLCVPGEISRGRVKEILDTFVGKFTQPYPHYSSKTVGGKPLFQWAREGRIGEIEIPTKEVEIYSIEKIGESAIAGKEILEQVQERIAKVNGDFRQEEILESWCAALEDKKEEKFHSIKIKVSCSSGTYMRTLAENIGNSVGRPALARSIRRTKIIV